MKDLGIVVEKASVHMCDVSASSYKYYSENHQYHMAHFWSSMRDMELGNVSVPCQIADPLQCDCSDAATDEKDVGWVSPSCRPWSSLGNTEDSKSPCEHEDWQVTFGQEGSLCSAAAVFQWRTLLGEQVPNFAKRKNREGLAGLERLVRVLKAIKCSRSGGARRFYTGWSAVIAHSDAWEDISRSRL